MTVTSQLHMVGSGNLEEQIRLNLWDPAMREPETQEDQLNKIN